VGSRFRVDGFIDFQRSILQAADRRLTSPLSIYIPGRQIPGVPLVKSGLNADLALGSQVQIMGNAVYVSGNNDHNLPAYMQVNVGAEKAFSPNATLDLVAVNLTHQYVGLFTSSRYAVPQLTQSGVFYFPNAAPLSQPDLFLRFTLILEHQ